MSIPTVAARVARLGAIFVAMAGLAACGGNNNTPLYANGTCNPGTAVQLAQPTSGQTAVSPSQNQVVLVASDMTNTLYYTYQQWYFTLSASNGTVITSGALNLYDGSKLNHPYSSDYYYNASISGLASGQTYGVKLYQSGTNCTPVTLGSFST